ncbi:hypothetical protein Rcae01_06610 [Novipirellula caenicola]|uniref:Uncharacterized protein n=1 Tax=Novipirellula caenicola TaxID=1536901 RepID=A0ABP9W140_9BACT
MSRTSTDRGSSLESWPTMTWFRGLAVLEIDRASEKVTSPNAVWERSSRAYGDCSGEGRPSKLNRTQHQDSAVGPHPDKASRARATSPRFAGRGDLLDTSKGCRSGSRGRLVVLFVRWTS